VPNTVATILNAAGGFAGINDATTVNTPIITYGLQYVGNDLQVNVQNVNFNPAAFAGGLNPNQTNVANHFQNVWGTGLPSNLADTMGYLVNFTNAAGYAAALDKLHPEPYLLQATGAVMTGLSFLDGMLSCRGSQAPLAAIRESQCAWFKFTGGAVNQQATSDAMGYREVGQRYQVGVQTAMAPDWWRGFAVSYETARTTTGSATTNADRFDIGVSVKHLHGNWLFATAANVGFATLDTSRFIGFPAPGLTAKGQTTIWHLDARFRASYLIESGITYAKPSVDVDLIYVNMAGFTETGAGPLNLRVNSVNEVMAALTPAIEFGASFRGNDGAAVVRPFASGGFSLFTRNNWTVSSTFEGTPTTVAPFNTSTAFPGMLYRTTLGVDFISTRKTGGLDMRFLYEGQFSHGYQSHTGSVKASVRF
jgi:hypothetical protein